MKPVTVVPYDSRWPELFSIEEQEVARLLAHDGAVTYHIGSTSVPGLCAKPVIDILVEVPDLELVDGAADAFTDSGYEAKGEYGIAGRRYFSRPATEGRIKVHVHAFQVGNPRIGQHLRFRDYLRAHPAVAVEYCVLKERLAAEHTTDRDAYQAGKEDFTNRVHVQAEAWSEGRQR